MRRLRERRFLGLLLFSWALFVVCAVQIYAGTTLRKRRSCRRTAVVPRVPGPAAHLRLFHDDRAGRPDRRRPASERAPDLPVEATHAPEYIAGKLVHACGVSRGGHVASRRCCCSSSRSRSVAASSSSPASCSSSRRSRSPLSCRYRWLPCPCWRYRRCRAAAASSRCMYAGIDLLQRGDDRSFASRQATRRGRWCRRDDTGRRDRCGFPRNGRGEPPVWPGTDRTWHLPRGFPILILERRVRAVEVVA